jgi:8-oxo-dGTP diphosphatase
MMNPFEAGSRKVIPACLVYLFRGVPGADEVLMMHRQGREGDYHSGKWNGLGGKFELDESPWQAASREISEEAGLLIAPERYHWLGTLQFPNFKAHKAEDWWCTVMTARLDADEAARIPEGARFSDEGSLHWVPAVRLLDLNLWQGDRLFLPKVLAGTSFSGTLWYEGQSVRAHKLA